LKDRFDELFGDIGNNPTPLKNAFIVLHLDFSVIYPGDDVKLINVSTRFTEIMESFVMQPDIQIYPVSSISS
jgi:hypothetical protein